MRRGQGAGLVSGFANLCVFMPPVPIWQSSGGNWLKCRNGNFVILALILLPQKPRPKNHHGALNRLGQSGNGKNRSGKCRSGTSCSGDHSRGVNIIFCRKYADHGHHTVSIA
jgi:hypothetical protein